MRGQWSNDYGVKALLAASPSSLTAGRLSWWRSGGGGSFVAPVASKPLAANRRGVGAGAGGSVANGWSAAAAGSGRKEVGGERRGHSFRMVTRLEIVNDADIPETAEFFVENFWDDAVAPSQKRSLVRELVSDYRRRYGTLMGNRKLQSMLMVARGNGGEIIGCIAVEVSVCMGERVGVKARGISPNAEGAELRPILANLAVARSERRKGLAKRLVKHCEDVCRGWGYDEVLLLVEENNKRARRLYSKLGYKMLFRDTKAKKILPDSYQIRDVPCVNVCMRRDLNANIFSNLFAMIRQ
ncbi:conserved unknown protein [Ectocarpus siliculosus]|uniref:N-acetyltransferase domain-containing protein n=1 Tax=Ectocarpus siliculosus TaxID=2880 RepID=D7FR70_ECTSI|nr:conserved unknown protein [Ectocarpus siliculosus]|eukprot:CBJ49195.1 conserved unknown protein [Ectocarpus siliculosus]